MQQLFTKDGIWAGSIRGLAMVSKPIDDTRLAAIVKALWASPTLEGCYRDSEKEPSAQERIGPEAVPNTNLYGIATVGDHKLPCVSTIARMDHEDWIYCAIPTAAIQKLLKPESTQTPAALVDEWALDLARAVYTSAQFKLAFVGFMPGTEEDHELKRYEATGVVPAQRHLGFVVPRGDTVAWHPPTD